MPKTKRRCGVSILRCSRHGHPQMLAPILTPMPTAARNQPDLPEARLLGYSCFRNYCGQAVTPPAAAFHSTRRSGGLKATPTGSALAGGTMSQPSADRLALLYSVTQAFTSSLDVTEVLNRVMDEVVAAVHAERGFLMLYDAQQRLTFRSARGRSNRPSKRQNFRYRAAWLSASRRMRHFPCSPAMRRVMPGLAAAPASSGWGCARSSVSLHLKQTTLGVIYVDNHLQAGIFSRDDLDCCFDCRQRGHRHRKCTPLPGGRGERTPGTRAADGA